MSDTTLRPEPPPPAPLDAEAITTKQRSQLQLVTLRFFRHRLAVGSLIVLLLVVAFAYLGPLVWWDHKIHLEIPSSAAPSADHPFGTTSAGHDVMGLVMRGTQQSLKVGLTAATISVVLAAIWGSIAGLFRGWVDAAMMRFADVILIIPLLVLVAAIAANFRGGTNWWGVALIAGFFSWPIYARIVRGMVLSLREQEFVEAARALGASDARIIGRHLIPNVTGQLIVAFTLLVALTVLLEAALSFLNFGIKPPDTSLGLQIAGAMQAMSTRPWLFYPPGLMLLIIALSVNFIGDGLRDAFDPKQMISRR